MIEQIISERFYELVRPPKPQKKRACLRCRKPITGFKMETRGARICAPCVKVINNLGALACV
jgi:hypothetical protein